MDKKIDIRHNLNEALAEDNLISMRARIERNASGGGNPSLELSVEYLRLFERSNKDNTDECARAMGYFIFLKDYIYNPLSSCKTDIDGLDLSLHCFFEYDLHMHHSKDVWLSAYDWRRLFAPVHETQVEPLFSAEIGPHRIILEKSYEDEHECDVYRVGIDGERTFWIEDDPQFMVDMNPEFITRDCLHEAHADALMETVGLDADAMKEVFAYFNQKTCRVCSKRFDYDGLYSPMLTDERWKEVYEHYGFTEDDDSFEDDDSLYICLECMEKALGRELVRDDVNDSQYNANYFESRGWPCSPVVFPWPGF